MKKTDTRMPADYIVPLTINGLHGRKLSMPATRKKYAAREILMLYGLHSSLERMFGIVENVADFGNVTMPDLPGFGGMDSFYAIGQAATIDAMADYLATFIKLQYKRKRFTIIAMSYGFVVATRMLAKYPDLASRVDLCVSLAGLTERAEFIVPKQTYYFWRFLAAFFDGRVRAWIFRYIILHPVFIRTTYLVQARSHPKMKGAGMDELKKRVDFEVKLWHINDVRTYMHVTKNILTLHTPPSRIDVPVLHISIDSDQYVDHTLVEKNIAALYTKLHIAKAHMPNHAPTIISDKSEAAAFIPAKARRMLGRMPKTT